MDELSTPGITALRHRQDNLVEHSLDRVSATYTWYRGLPQDARTQIASVARLGVEMFVDWVENRSAAASPTRIFSVAPATLTGVVTLDQTLGLVRTVLDVVLEEAPLLVPEDEHDISAPRMRLTPVCATAAAASSQPVVVSWSVSAIASSPACAAMARSCAGVSVPSEYALWVWGSIRFTI